MVKSVTSMLRLSFAEMMVIETVLSLAVKGSNVENPRVNLVRGIRDKILLTLEQAEKDGLIDAATLEKQLGLRKYR